MAVVSLADELDFDGWRTAARRLRAEGVAPTEVAWRVGEGDLFAPFPLNGGRAGDGGVRTAGAERTLMGSEPISDLTAAAGLHPHPNPSPIEGEGLFRVPKDFIDLAEAIICHRDPTRFALLYRILWRLRDDPNLLKIVTDPDVARARDMAKSVSLASHKMKAFVRFRQIEDEAGEAYVAWFEPAHRVVRRTAGFFVRRFTSLRFAILTPDVCAHWDGALLTFSPGADRSAAPKDDELEDFWRTYYASIFNPARLKVKAMQAEMPKKYWRNLPEASLIPELIAKASERSEIMVQAQASAPRKGARVAAPARVAPPEGAIPPNLAAIAEMIQSCGRCDLYKCATQGVPGEGPGQARLMLVGEQPGDQEDLAGKPFVGPAGQMLDRAMQEAGLPRAEVYVTNAVKHFKHEARGKRRLHKTPDGGEVAACRWWLEHEMSFVRPRLVLALGATAALSVLGKATPIGKSRGQLFQLPDQSQAMVTMHPSYLLRIPDRDAKAQAYNRFVEDLAAAWKYAA